MFEGGDKREIEIVKFEKASVVKTGMETRSIYNGADTLFLLSVTLSKVDSKLNNIPRDNWWQNCLPFLAWLTQSHGIQKSPTSTPKVSKNNTWIVGKGGFWALSIFPMVTF